MNLWIMAWNHHILPHDPLHYLDGNIFHPHPSSITCSEHLFIPSMLVWPISAATNNPLLAYYAMIALGFLGTFWTMYLLAREYGMESPGAFLAASVFALSPMRVVEALGHVQTLQFYGGIAALLFLRRWFRTLRVRDAIGLMLALAVQLLSTFYLSVFAGMLIVMAIAFRFSRGGRFTLRAALGLGAAGLGAIVIAAPYIVPYLTPRFEEEMDLPAFQGISLWGYLIPTPTSLWAYLSAPAGSVGEHGFAYLGYSALLVAVSGFVLMWRSGREHRGICYFLLVALSFGVICSMGAATFGPNGVLQHYLPYIVLLKCIPLLESIRGISRYALIAHFSIALLAGYGLLKLVPGKRPTARWIGAVSIAAVMLLETHLWVKLAPGTFVPSEVDRFLSSVSEDTVVAMIPHRSDPLLLLGVDYQAHSIFHWCRLINGESRYFPPEFKTNFGVLNTFPSQQSLDLLRELNVDLVVINPKGYLETETQTLQAAINESAAAEDFRLISDFIIHILDNPLYQSEQWKNLEEECSRRTDLVCLARHPSGWIFSVPR